MCHNVTDMYTAAQFFSFLDGVPLQKCANTKSDATVDAGCSGGKPYCHINATPSKTQVGVMHMGTPV